MAGLSVTLSATDRITPALKSISNYANRARKGLEALSTSSGKAFNHMSAGADRAAKSIEKMSGSIERNADKTADKLEKTAEKMAQSTQKMQAQALKSASIMSLAMDKASVAVDRLTTLSKAMSSAMGGARKSMEEASTAAKQLSTISKEVGSSMKKTGTESARGMAETANALNKSIAKITEAAVKAQNKSKETIGGIEAYTNPTARSIQKIGYAFSDFGQRISGAGTAFNKLKSIGSSLGSALSKLLSPLSAIKKGFSTLGSIGSSVFSKVKSSASTAFSKIKSLGSTALNKVTSAFKSAGKSILSFVTNAIKLPNVLSKAKSAMSGVNSEVAKAPGLFKKLASAVANVITRMTLFYGIRKIMNMVTDSISTAINRLDTMDVFARKMELITGSADDASYALEELKASTKGTPYALDKAASSVQNFVLRGMSTQDAVKSVNTWMDVIATFGRGTNDEFETVMDALAKMRTKGTVEMKQLNRLFQVGINPVQAYAQAVGRTTAEVQDDLSNRKITAEDFIRIVEEAYRTGVNGVTQVTGMARKAGTTWQGVMENMRIAVARGMVSVIEAVDEAFKVINPDGLKGVLKNFGNFMEDWLGDVAELIKQILPPFLQLGKSLVTAFTPLFNIIKNIGSSLLQSFIKTGIPSITSFANTVAEYITTKVVPAMQALQEEIKLHLNVDWKDGIDAIKNTTKKGLKHTLKELSRLGEYLSDVLINEAIPMFLDFANQFERVFFYNILPMAMHFFRIVTPAFMDFAREVIPPLISLIKKMAPMTILFIADVVRQLLNLGREVLPTIFDLISTIAPKLMIIAGEAIPLIGKGLKFILSVIQQVVPPLAKLVIDMMPTFSRWLDTIISLGNQILPVIISLAKQAFPLFVKAIDTALNVAQQFLPVILDLAQQAFPIFEKVFNFLLETIPKVIPILLELAQKILPVLSEALDTILPIIDTLVSKGLPKLLEFAEKVGSSLKNVYDKSVDPFKQGFEEFKNNMLTMIEELKTQWAGLWEGIRQRRGEDADFTSIINPGAVLGGMFSGFSKFSNMVVPPIFDALIKVFLKLLDISDRLNPVFQKLNNALKEFGTWLGEIALPASLQTLVNVFGKIADYSADITERYLPKLVDGFTAIGHSIGKQFELNMPTLKGNLSDSFETYKSGMWEGLDKIVNSVINLGWAFARLMPHISHFISVIAQVASLVVPPIFNALARIISFLADNIEFVIAGVVGFAGALGLLKVASVVSTVLGTLIGVVSDVVEAFLGATGIFGRLAAVIEVFVPVTTFLTALVAGFIALTVALSAYFTAMGYSITQVNGLFQHFNESVQGIGQSVCESISGMASNFVHNSDTIATKVGEFGQMMGNVGMNIIQTGIVIIGQIGNVIITAVGAFARMLPAMLKVGIAFLANFIIGILDKLPDLIDTALDTVFGWINTIAEWLPDVLSCGVKLIWEFIRGIITYVPVLLQKMNECLGKLIGVIIEHIPDFVVAIVHLMAALGKALIDSGHYILEGLQELWSETIWPWLKTLPQRIWEWIVNTIVSIGQAIKDIAGDWKKLSDPATWDFFKNDPDWDFSSAKDSAEKSAQEAQDAFSDTDWSFDWSSLFAGDEPLDWNEFSKNLKNGAPTFNTDQQIQDLMNGMNYMQLLAGQEGQTYYDIGNQYSYNLMDGMSDYLNNTPLNMAPIMSEDVMNLMLQQGNAMGTDFGSQLTQGAQSELAPLQTMPQQLLEGYSILPQQGTVIGSGFGTNFAQGVNGIDGLGSSLGTGFGNNFSTGIGETEKGAVQQSLKFVTGTTQAINTAQPAFNMAGMKSGLSFNQGMQSQMSQGVKMAQQYSQAMTASMTEEVRKVDTKAIENLANSLLTMTKRVMSSISVICGNITLRLRSTQITTVSIVRQMINKILSQFTRFKNEAPPMVANAGNKILNYMQQIRDKGTNIMTRARILFLAQVNLLCIGAQKAYNTLVKNIADKLASLPAYHRSIGEALMVQLKDGINAKKNEVTTALSSLVQQMKEVFLKGMGIHSPSRFTTYVADMMTAGLFKGWDQEKVMAFFNNVVGSMQTSFKNGKFNAGELINFLGDANIPPLVAKLSSIDASAVTPINIPDGQIAYPLAGGPYPITSDYGPRNSPGGIGSTNHKGIDIGAPNKTPILSILPGVVSLAEWYGGYGNAVKVNHGGGFESLYGHMSAITVSEGQTVAKGQQVGLEGSTGNSTGPHLHFSTFQDGEFFNPYELLMGSGIASATSGVNQTVTKPYKELAEHIMNALTQKQEAVKLAQQAHTSNAKLDPEILGDDTLRNVVLTALALNNEPASYLNDILWAIQNESSGNAHAINLWDSNADLGTPSKGLMQVIDPTFERYALDGYNTDIYDPVSNVAAAINYMKHEYDGIENVMKSRREHWKGYAVGTRKVPEDMFAMIHKDEAILPKTQNPYSQSGGDYLMDIGSTIGRAVMSEQSNNEAEIDVPDMSYRYSTPTDNRSVAMNNTFNIQVQNDQQADHVADDIEKTLHKLLRQGINTAPSV